MSTHCRPHIFRPAIFSCSVTGCTRSFKSESALKRHQTAFHIVPDTLHPRHGPDLTRNTNEHPLFEDADVQPPDDYPLPQDEFTFNECQDAHPYDGLHMNRHPILDGACIFV
jgi:hypothetical protein